MSLIRYATNESGTRVSVHTCKSCGGEFTVCPAVEADQQDQWENCLSETCPSYDLRRDIDLLWDHSEVVREEVNPDA